MFFQRKKKKLPKIEFSGVSFESPLITTLTPPKDGILEWISQLKSKRQESVLAVNLRRDIPKSFALLYDFVDFLIVDTASDTGGTSELSDITDLMDELLSLRLCYEHYTRVLVRITDGLTPQEVGSLLDYCRLSGIDGVVVNGARHYDFAYEHTQGRLPVIVSSDSPQEVLEMCRKGVPVETKLNGIQRLKILKSLTDNA